MANKLVSCGGVVSGCVSDAFSELESLGSEVEQLISEIEDLVSEAEGCEFPGMYG